MCVRTHTHTHTHTHTPAGKVGAGCGRGAADLRSGAADSNLRLSSLRAQALPRPPVATKPRRRGERVPAPPPLRVVGQPSWGGARPVLWTHMPQGLHVSLREAAPGALGPTAPRHWVPRTFPPFLLLCGCCEAVCQVGGTLRGPARPGAGLLGGGLSTSPPGSSLQKEGS